MPEPATVGVVLPILIREPWQVHMTYYCVKMLREQPGADFKLIVVETEGEHLKYYHDSDHAFHGLIDKYIHFDEGGHFVRDVNAGVQACDTEFVVVTGNDVFVRPGWLDAMLEPFRLYDNCGVSTLASSDLPPPFSTKMDRIVEGVYGPHICFRRWGPEVGTSLAGTPGRSERLFDPAFKTVFVDTDFIMTLYEEGLRSYRNHRVVIDHLNKATYNEMYDPEEQERQMAEARELFAAKHERGSHLMMYNILTGGRVV